MTLTEKIKSIDLIGVVQAAGVQLRKTGKNFVGLCPFHNDRSPSLVVYPENLWWCYACQIGRDAVDFIQRLNGCDFKTACKYLGIEVGAMTAEDRNRIIDLKRIRKQREIQRRRESDLAFTLGTLIRQTRHAMTALTPNNLDDHAGLIDQLPYYEHAHDLLIHGSSSAKTEVVKAFKDFKTINRNHLWNQAFDYRGWLRKCQKVREPNETTVKNFFR